MDIPFLTLFATKNWRKKRKQTFLQKRRLIFSLQVDLMRTISIFYNHTFTYAHWFALKACNYFHRSTNELIDWGLNDIPSKKLLLSDWPELIVKGRIDKITDQLTVLQITILIISHLLLKITFSDPWWHKMLLVYGSILFSLPHDKSVLLHIVHRHCRSKNKVHPTCIYFRSLCR